MAHPMCFKTLVHFPEIPDHNLQCIMPVAIQGDLKPVRFPCTTICLTIALPVAIPENPIKQYASPAQQFADSGPPCSVATPEYVTAATSTKNALQTCTLRSRARKRFEHQRAELAL
jgi:hypothetical protein